MADVGDIIRCALTYASPGASDQKNVFWYEVQDMGIGNPAMLQELADFFTNVWHPTWENIAADTSQMVDISVDIMNPDGTVKVNVGVEPLGLLGDEATGVLPPADSGYLLAQTALPKSRGSKYVPGIAEGSIADGEFTNTALAFLLVMALEYILPVTTGVGAVLFPGILSRAAQVFVEFLPESSSTDIVGYQRRRKPNVGS